MKTGHMDIDAVALDAIHHGAGTMGNMSILRSQEVESPDGTMARVPYISGNSLRHMVRDGGARFAIEAMGIQPGTLSKAIVDVLFSGGGLTKGGSAINLEQARKLERLFPLLPLLGYSAGNTMTRGKLSVDNLHLVCRENAFRLRNPNLPQAERPAASYIADQFGTRHEATRDPMVAGMLTSDTRAALEGAISASAASKVKAEKGDTTQMIYEYEVIRPGALFEGRIGVQGLTDLELGALQSALGRACEGMHGDAYMFRVGAKGNQGHGRMAWRFSGALRHIATPQHAQDNSLATLGSGAPLVEAYAEHIRQNAAEIIQTLEAAV